MPAPLDLTGNRYGNLTVLRQNGRMKFGHEQTAWLCRCDCGAEITVPQNRLPHRTTISSRHAVTACPDCRRPICDTCGEKIMTGSLTQRTHPGECTRTRRKQIELDSYYRRLAKDPEMNKRNHIRAKARAAKNPELSRRREAQMKAARAKVQLRIKTDPEYRAKVLAAQRATYARHAEAIQAKRKARFEALTPEQKARWMDRVRGYGRAYRRKWRDELRTNPERHQKYKDLMREYNRLRELAKLLKTAEQLINRGDNEPDRND